jgi:hypothetical protein
VAIKGGMEKGWVDGGRVSGLLGFVALCMLVYITVVVVEGACARVCKGVGVVHSCYSM